MKKFNLFILVFFSFLVIIQPVEAGERPLRVVATTGMITDLIENLGGSRVKVTGLMGAGVDPHLYKAAESDVFKLAQAEIIFYNGLHLEGRMADVFEQMRRMKPTVALGERLETNLLLNGETDSGHADPHIWFDVSLWMKAAQAATAALVEIDPEGMAEYHAHRDHYLTQLRELDEYARNRAAELPLDRRVLVTAHDAFGYFGNAYGFEVHGLQGLSTATEAGARNVMELADFIVERKIPAIFVESSIPERNLQAVQEAARARGWIVTIGGELFSDAMGAAGTPEGTYIGMVRHNIDTIVEALKNKRNYNIVSGVSQP